MSTRIVAHLDMDAFFAAVEERDKPYLKGLPIIIGADPKGGAGRGVVSTASYPARQYGVFSATPISTAWRLCEEARKDGKPACVFVTPDFSRYEKASREVFDIVRHHAHVIEQTGIDEAYIDMGFSGSFKKAVMLARTIKREVQNTTKLTCSVGVAPNKLVAKIASDHQKPDGLTVVTAKRAEQFLAPLLVKAIPGIGPKAAQALRALGAESISDARRFSWEELERRFGSQGLSLWERFRGIDERPIAAEAPERKSIGKHFTFDTDTHDMEEVLAVIKEQANEIMDTLKRKSFRSFKTVVVTVRFTDFTTNTRSLTLDAPANSARSIILTATKLLFPFFEKSGNPEGKAIRLVGVRIEKLV